MYVRIGVMCVWGGCVEVGVGVCARVWVVRVCGVMGVSMDGVCMHGKS